MPCPEVLWIWSAVVFIQCGIWLELSESWWVQVWSCFFRLNTSLFWLLCFAHCSFLTRLSSCPFIERLQLSTILTIRDWKANQIYHQISSIMHTKSQNLNVSCLILLLSLCYLLRPGDKSRMKMLLEQHQPPTTFEWAIILNPTKVCNILRGFAVCLDLGHK